jgi:hypothetical protein
MVIRFKNNYLKTCPVMIIVIAVYYRSFVRDLVRPA